MANTTSILLGDENYFIVDNGERIRKKDINKAKGDIPVYSSSKYKNETLGLVSDDIKKIVPNAKKFSGLCITINADATDYSAFVRNEEFYANDVVNVIKTISEKIYLPFVAYQLNNLIKTLNLGWNNKLYKGKLKTLEIDIPIDSNGEFDLDTQKEIAKKYEKIERIKENLMQDYDNLKTIEVEFDSNEKTKEIELEEIFDFSITTNRSFFTKKFINEHKGKIPVYSASKNQESVDYGYVEDNLPNVKYFENCLTWNIDGSIGKVFFRNGKFSLSEKVIPLIIKEDIKKRIDLNYLKYEIEKKLALEGFGFSKKAGKGKIKNLYIDIPIDSNGEFDLDTQKEIAKKYEKIERIKENLMQDYEHFLSYQVEIC